VQERPLLYLCVKCGGGKEGRGRGISMVEQREGGESERDQHVGRDREGGGRKRGT
jgi:hypothetical protein